MIKKVSMSIAGLDTGNGAGAESDLKVMEILGVHPVIAVTAITAQNTMGISAIYPVDAEYLKKEITALMSDFDVASIKIGMIYNKEQFRVVQEFLHNIPVVTDPVIYAKDGTQLINDIDDYKKMILAKSTVITPNAVEASILSGIKIESINDAEKAAKELYKKFGNPYIIIKGGHINGDYSFDILYDGKDFFEIGYNRLYNKNTHGTGSIFASIIAAEMAKGNSVYNAFLKSKEILQVAISNGLSIGKGIGPIDPVSYIEKNSQKYEVLENMRKFGDFIENTENFWKLIPEVQSNFAHSIMPNYVNSLQDIATFRGRILRRWDKKVVVGYPAVFGNPTHTARLLFSIISMGENARNLINIRFDEKIIHEFKKLGYEVIEINRELEPIEQEGSTMQWIAKYVKENYNKIPNVIYDRGMKGKEAMIRYWTENLEEMMYSLKSICNNI
ncbi:bifunctional hydroxymethylpyrimidine kinase/phosphomethylpyrimidine kinase [Acidianus sulfidivorans JP7]|uniref:Bifunctional hydroxymethylpyrimidine kinase/phosphomethylpyrimidine kinase n=1 Tax=Acidianus sulfidivorans JP7 TaxID=619593 RepID=A0A2U9IKV7_9CREN|nr:bifunctional hydroxymethylpyrimidine kinase/phosphomethylpyrimidine kinase [Acidianus sulfidivorans]AWR96651.1 bifunctional hydroxymethylpyrimidine kinase/phosphomethylpyrimidine kinase [Acidianus sulfidivorans JP7]